MVGEHKLSPLGLETTKKVVCAELEDVGGLGFDNFTVEGRDLVGVVGGKRHWRWWEEEEG